jgi:hypothetical protein
MRMWQVWAQLGRDRQPPTHFDGEPWKSAHHNPVVAVKRCVLAAKKQPGDYRRSYIWSADICAKQHYSEHSTMRDMDYG